MDRLQKIRLFKKLNKAERYFDFSLLFVVILLTLFGILMIFSASSYEANAAFENPAHYLIRQSIAAGIGFVLLVAFSFFPYKYFRKIPAWVYYAIALLFVLLLLVPGITKEGGGATRWIKLFGGFNIQPAEIAKFCIILCYAKFMSGYNYILKKWQGIAVALGLLFPLVMAIWKISDNLSSALIVLGIVYLMCFIASGEWKKFAILTASMGGVAALFVFLVVRFVDPYSEGLGFRLRRIIAWIHPEYFQDSTSYQTIQSLYAIGSGGLFGKGIGESMQKLSYIPEAQNDMIFAIICEELGLFGALGVITLFVILLWRLMTIAYNTKDLFGALIVVGVFAHIAIQAVMNIAVVTNTMPNTGVSLPFISYGGSSILFLMIEIGIVLNIASQIKVKE